MIPRHRGGRIHRLRRCHNHAWQAGRNSPPLLQPPIVHLYRCSGEHRGWDIHAHGADCLHAQHQAVAQKRARSKDSGTLPSEREGAQHYRSTDLLVYGTGRSFETFGWVPPMTVGWRQTSGCATLWGCSMVHRGKNIVNGSKKYPIYPCNVRAVHQRPQCMSCIQYMHWIRRGGAARPGPCMRSPPQPPPPPPSFDR